MAKTPAKKVPNSRFPRKPPSGQAKKAPTPTGKKDRKQGAGSTAQMCNNLSAYK